MLKTFALLLLTQLPSPSPTPPSPPSPTSTLKIEDRIQIIAPSATLHIFSISPNIPFTQQNNVIFLQRELLPAPPSSITISCTLIHVDYIDKKTTIQNLKIDYTPPPSPTPPNPPNPIKTKYGLTNLVKTSLQPLKLPPATLASLKEAFSAPLTRVTTPTHPLDPNITPITTPNELLLATATAYRPIVSSSLPLTNFFNTILVPRLKELNASTTPPILSSLEDHVEAWKEIINGF